MFPSQYDSAVRASDAIDPRCNNPCLPFPRLLRGIVLLPEVARIRLRVVHVLAHRWRSCRVLQPCMVLRVFVREVIPKVDKVPVYSASLVWYRLFRPLIWLCLLDIFRCLVWKAENVFGTWSAMWFKPTSKNAFTKSSWLQIQRSGFDSWPYQIFREVMGLERGPLSLVTTIEELF
jgi:hypothetical protein